MREIKTIDDLPDFFSVKELAALLRICEAAAYSLTRRRGFPCMRLSGRTIRISKAGFQAWAQENFRLETPNSITWRSNEGTGEKRNWG